MTILEIDAGNTRVKWRLLLADQGPGAKAGMAGIDSGAVSAADPGLLPTELATRLSALSGVVNRIRVANVRGAAFEQVLSALCLDLFAQAPEFARVSGACGGLHNGYENGGGLGVDRWLAMLAAFQREQRQGGGSDLWVVDFGSAITVDLVDSAGQHQGGYIVPGLDLMRQALADKSAALAMNKVSDKESDKKMELAPSLLPGRTTKTAISHGALVMALGLLGQVPVAARGLVGKDSHGKELVGKEEARWYLTGGDAARISSYWKQAHELVPELVLDGLAIALP